MSETILAEAWIRWTASMAVMTLALVVSSVGYLFDRLADDLTDIALWLHYEDYDGEA